MTLPTIHVHTQSDKNTIAYVGFMWETMRSLANHPDALKLSVHCMGPTAAEKLATLVATTTFHVPNVSPDQGLVGSTGHAACIDHALEMTDDGVIHVVADSDTVVVARGWDDYIRLSTLDRNVGILGSAVEDLGGFSSGSGTCQLAKNLPTMTWCALSPLHSWRNLRVQPRKEANIEINTEALSKVYNLPVGYQVLRDVGWQIPQYLADNEIPYEAWRQRKGSKDAVIIKGLSDYHEEYHAGETPFVVHQRGSMRHAYRSEKTSQLFYNAVDSWLATEKARPTRWKWTENDGNMVARETMQRLAAEAKDRPARVIPPAQARALAAIDEVAPGWLKATLNGKMIWSRHVAAPRTLNVEFTPIPEAMQHLRLEGTTSDINVVLPAAVAGIPHVVTVRNAIQGPATISSVGGTVALSVNSGACFSVLVDVDGVFHLE